MPAPPKPLPPPAKFPPTPPSATPTTPPRSPTPSPAAASSPRQPSTPPPQSSPPTPARRARRKTRVFEIAAPAPPPRQIHVPPLRTDSNAVRLNNIPNVTYALDRLKPKDPVLELLHRVLFAVPGNVVRRRANIRAFSGFAFVDDRDRARVRDKLARAHLNLVRRIATTLDVPVAPPPQPYSSSSAPGPVSASAPDHTPSTTITPTTTTTPAVSTTSVAAPVSVPASVSASIPINNPDITPATSAPRPNDQSLLEEIFGDDPDSDNDIQTQLPPRAMNNTTSTDKDVPIRRDEIIRAGKDDAITAILAFLENPVVLQGRQDLAARDKAQKAQRKAAERARAAKAALKRKAEEEERLLAEEASRRSESDDGDEDLTTALPWIEIARNRAVATIDVADDVAADTVASAPVESTRPTDSTSSRPATMKPVRATKPSKSTKSTKISKPAKSTKPTKSPKSTKSDKSDKSSKPGKSAKSAKSGKPPKAGNKKRQENAGEKPAAKRRRTG